MKNIFILLSFIFLFSYTVSHAQCNHAQDYAALRELYLATGGDNWTNNSGWPDSITFMINATPPVGTDLGSWYGVGCKNSRVDFLNLYNNKLKGTLPIVNLDSLKSLNLSSHYTDNGSNNILIGEIPNFNLPMLQYLSLSYNQLSGTIPDFILPNLTQLFLAGNQFSGSIPNFNLPNLRQLWLDRNQLKGNIPNFNLPNLEELILSENQLSGSIPNFNLPNLRKLWLYYNQLRGSVPDFQFLSNFTEINLDKNNLSGCFPESLKRFCGNNKFRSDINPLLPWGGAFWQFCETDGSHAAQVGAHCFRDTLYSEGYEINDDCSCGDCSNPPDPPIIACAEKTTSSVTFEWTNVEGATSYDVTIIEPASASGSIIPGTNQYIVTGLDLGQFATIEVTAIIDDPCGSVTSLPHSCAAEDCGVLPIIIVQPIAPICMPGSSFTLVDSLVTVDPEIPGSVGTFTVNGTPANVFDPVALGAGSHKIVYTLSWDDGRCQQQASRVVIVNDITPLSDFTVSSVGCILDSVTVTYTGGTSGGIYTWSFGSDVIGSYNGPGPHVVTWSAPGTKTISLSVEKDGCTSTVTTHTVSLNPVLSPPVITCIDSRIDGVTFEWDAVINADSYDIVVQIEGGAIVFQGNVNDLSFDVGSLSEGTRVSITVTAVSNNGCPNTSSSRTCEATSCPNAQITFPNPTRTECLTSGLAPLLLTYTIRDTISDVPSTVVWSSTNPTTNAAINNSSVPPTFNYQIAGTGQHFITVTHQQINCIWADSMLITLRPVPVASFTSRDVICVTEDLAVNYTGTSTTGRILTWDDGGAIRTDITATEFSYRFPAPGIYTIGLRVTLSGCESELFTKTIVVEDIPTSPVLNCSSRIDGVTFSWQPVEHADSYDIVVQIVGGSEHFRGNVTDLSYDVNGIQEGTQVMITVTAISTNGCPNTSSFLICEAKSCPIAQISFPEYSGGQIVYCLDETPELIPLHFNITNHLDSITPEITWTNSSEHVRNAIDNDTIPATFDPYRVGMGDYNLQLIYKQSSCVWIDSLQIHVIDPDFTILYPDTIWLEKDDIETINILANDILPEHEYTLMIKEFPTSELTLVDFDITGQLAVTTSKDLNEEQIIIYEVCDLCDACHEGKVYVINKKLQGITQTNMFTPHESTNRVLQFSEKPVEGSELWIYNRWGQLIFRQETYQNDWTADGYPGGVYYYVFKVYGITIKRAMTVVK